MVIDMGFEIFQQIEHIGGAHQLTALIIVSVVMQVRLPKLSKAMKWLKSHRRGIHAEVLSCDRGLLDIHLIKFTIENKN